MTHWLKGTLTAVQEQQPLIVSITNQVVIQQTANGLIALGASPVMSNYPDDAEALAKVAGAVLLNIGTLNELQLQTLLAAGKGANAAGIPVVLDPVGAGASTYRTEAVNQILEEVQVDVIRGNAGEIAAISGQEWGMKGVDSSGSGDAIRLAERASEKFGKIVIVTGEQDVITDGATTYLSSNGTRMLTAITGAGCVLGAVIAAFLGTDGEQSKLQKCAAAVSFYSVVAEKAADGAHGPSSFEGAFRDGIYMATEEGWLPAVRMEERVAAKR